MMVLKFFIVFMVYFIHNISGNRFSYFLYKTGVIGTPICKYADRGSITVYISEKPHLQKEKKPIAWTIAQYKSSFFLKSVVKRWKQPRLYVKIFHSCSKKLSPCEKMFMKTIPSQYIAPSRKVVSMFNLGTVELSSKSSMGETCQKRLSF